LNDGYLCEIELVPELYANTALKQAIISEMKMVFGHDTRISIVLARPNMPTRIGGQRDRQARVLVLSVIRQFTNQ
jgi:hypothetical protein